MDETAATPAAIGKEELLSAVKYGLSKITANAASSISDEDIDTILRKVQPRMVCVTHSYADCCDPGGAPAARR